MNLQRKKTFLLLFLIFLLSGTLRLYQLVKVPIALHGDELGVAYNAFTLLNTAKDEYGHLLPLTFRNDFMPLIFYLSIPFVSFLGLSEIAVRLPTAIVSLVIIPLLFLVIRTIFKNNRLALLASFLLALSSWDIRIARIGVGITLPLFFQLVGLFLFYKSFYASKKHLTLSFLFFSLSLFTYQSARMTTPLLIILILWIYRKSSLVKKNFAYISFLYVILIIIPSVGYFFLRPITDSRFAGISIFTQWRSNFLVGSLLIDYLKPVFLLKLVMMFIFNYLRHFDPKILFWDNSNLRYHQLSGQGLFYLWQAIFLIVGFLSNLRRIGIKSSKLLLSWFLIAPIPSALTTGVPYANISRALMLLPVMLIFIAQGILITIKYIREKNLKYPVFIFGIVFLVILALSSFIKNYFSLQPELYNEFWGLPLKKAALAAVEVEKDVDKIIFTTSVSPQSYIYVLFYGNKDPLWLFDNKSQRSQIVGYEKIGKYEFRKINWDSDMKISNTLIVGTPEEIPPESDNVVKEIFASNGKASYRIVKTVK